jgi:hypothetical protein
MLAQLRQSCAVHALGAQHIDVIPLRELFEREGFGRTKDHMTGVVDDYIQAPVFSDDHGSFSCSVRIRGVAKSQSLPADSPNDTALC